MAVDYVVLSGPVYLVNTAAPFFAQHVGIKTDPGDALLSLLHSKANPPTPEVRHARLKLTSRNE